MIYKLYCLYATCSYGLDGDKRNDSCVDVTIRAYLASCVLWCNVYFDFFQPAWNFNWKKQNILYENECDIPFVFGLGNKNLHLLGPI